MSLVSYLFDTGPEGTALTNANSGSVASSIGAGSSTSFAAAYAAHGNFGARFTNGSAANCYRRYPLAAPNQTWQFSGVITMPSSFPAANLIAASFCNSGGAGRLQIGINPSGQLIIAGASGGATAISSVLTASARYRITLQVVGGSTTNSQVTAKIYSEMSGSWTTQSGSTWTSTTYNTGTDDVIGADIGVINSSATSYTVGWDDIQLNDSVGGEISDITVQLATPVVSLGATTPPSTVGASNGAQVVTWAAVPGAVSYEAWIAAGSTPLQGDFTLVSTGVTSPYQFTNLTAGDWSYGIKAKA